MKGSHFPYSFLGSFFPELYETKENREAKVIIAGSSDSGRFRLVR